MGNLKLAADIVAKEIAALVAACPEMADDEDLKRDMIEGETSAKEFLRWATREYLAAKGLAEGAAESAKTLAARKARFERRQEAFKLSARRIWELAGKVKQELPEGTLNTRKGTEYAHITDEDFLPDRFLKKEPKKAEILAALKAGETVPGATLKRGDPPFVITAS